MIHDLLLFPVTGAPLPVLSFRWDEETGEVTGCDAEEVRCRISLAELGRAVPVDPLLCYHTLSSSPLRSRRDMAGEDVNRWLRHRRRSIRPKSLGTRLRGCDVWAAQVSCRRQPKTHS